MHTRSELDTKLILRRQVKDWLDSQVPEMDILVTPPAHTFDVEEIGFSGRNATLMNGRSHGPACKMDPS